MKLYLSSQKLGNNIPQLLSLCGQNKNVAVIANGLDNMSDSHRKWRVQLEIESLKSIWLTPEELDLRKYFNNPEDLQKLFIREKWWLNLYSYQD